MAFSVIDSASAGSNTSGDVTTSAIDTTGADLLVAAVAFEAYSDLEPISDSKGNTWVALTQANSGTGRANRIFYVASPTVGTGHTFTFGNGTGINPVGVALALSGAAASPFDVENGAGSVANNLSPGSVTPSEDNEIIISGACLAWPSVPSVAIDSGFTLEFFGYGSISTGGGLAYLIQTSAGTVTPTWTFDFAHCASAIATFKAAAAAATKAPPIFRRSTRFFRRSA